jgi:hypothetical protein
VKPLDPTAQPSRRELHVHLTENLPVVDGVRVATASVSISPARTTRASTSIRTRASRSDATTAESLPTTPSSTRARLRVQARPADHPGLRRNHVTSGRRDQGLHDLIAPDAAIERIAGGLTFTEGLFEARAIRRRHRDVGVGIEASDIRVPEEGGG